MPPEDNPADDRWALDACRAEIDRLKEVNAVLLAACEAAVEARRAEWLYQTGQTVRPAQDYPPRGSVCGELGDLLAILKAAIDKAKPP